MKKGAVVVAAVGNSDEAYTTPWPYASWPAALPHVIGVGALTRVGQRSGLLGRGSDLRRPRRAGSRHLLHLPEAADGAAAGLPGAGLHRLRDRRLPAPRGHLVRGAAGVGGRGRPLRPRPVAHEQPGDEDPRAAHRRRQRLERLRPQCPTGRDKFSGWGRLDVAKAVDFLDSGSPLPPSDRFEPNDSVSQAHKLWGKRPAVDATLDYWDDPVDVYRVRLEPRAAAAARGSLPGGRTRRRPDAAAAGHEVAARQRRRRGPEPARRQDAAALVSRAARRLVRTSSCGSRVTAAAATRCT